MTAVSRPPVGLSPMHDMHSRAGAEMAELDGWLLPSRYTTPSEEVDRARGSAGMCDVSSTGKLIVYADDMERCPECRLRPRRRTRGPEGTRMGRRRPDRAHGAG